VRARLVGGGGARASLPQAEVLSLKHVAPWGDFVLLSDAVLTARRKFGSEEAFLDRAR
jgi:hypothetical protein